MSLSAGDPVASAGPDPAKSAAPTGEARSDARQRMIVDDAIGVLGSTNTMSAFEYLRSHGVRTHVIERVLLEPLRRRALV